MFVACFKLSSSAKHLFWKWVERFLTGPRFETETTGISEMALSEMPDAFSPKLGLVKTLGRTSYQWSLFSFSLFHCFFIVFSSFSLFTEVASAIRFGLGRMKTSFIGMKSYQGFPLGLVCKCLHPTICIFSFLQSDIFITMYNERDQW